MKKISYLLAPVIALVLVCFVPAKAATDAEFTITSARTSYKVGEEITTTYSVDAGPYATSLSTIDFEIKVSDSSVIQPSNANAPFTAGSIYSQTAIESVTDNIINVVTHINPESKPASRSGEIGTIKFKAVKSGTVTLSYNSIQAAEENTEDNFVTTTAGSLTLNISDATSTVSTSSASTTRVVATATPRPVLAATTARTGPESAVLFAIGGGTLIFFSYKRMLRGKK